MSDPTAVADIVAKTRARRRPRTGLVTVFLRNLAVQTVIGVAEWERRAPRTLLFDIDVKLGSCRAGDTDRVGDTVDYAAVAASVRAKLGGEVYCLLERAAEDVVDLLLDEFGADAACVRVAKVGVVPNAGSVGVSIERVRAHR